MCVDFRVRCRINGQRNADVWLDSVSAIECLWFVMGISLLLKDMALGLFLESKVWKGVAEKRGFPVRFVI